MATVNPFDLLVDDDAEDPSQLVAAQQKKKAVVTQPPIKSSVAKLPSKPLPPSEALRESKNEAARGSTRGGGRGYGGPGRGRGGGGFNRDVANNENPFDNKGGRGAPVDRGTGKSSDRRGNVVGYRPSHHVGWGSHLSNGEAGDEEGPRRVFERHSGTGRGNDIKREGGGRGNWGTQRDEFAEVTETVANENDKNVGAEKPVTEVDVAEGNKENPVNVTNEIEKLAEEKEREDKEMTLEEYEKLLEEKRKTLQGLKTEERKVDAKEFASMQQISSKKGNTDIFAKLGSDKDKKKDAAEKEEKNKKSLSINEFLKPVDGDRNYSSGGRGRGRGSRGGFSGGSVVSSSAAPSIEDPRQFPTLGAK